MSSDVRKNYIYHVIYKLSSCILPLIVTPYVARVLGVGNNGLYAFSSTVACYFIMLGKLGLDNYGNRSIAFVRNDPQKRSQTFWSIYALQVITALLAIGLYLYAVFAFFQGHLLIYLMQLIYVTSVLFDVSWFFYGMERFFYTTVRSLVTRTLLIAGVFLFVSTEKDLWIYTGLMSASFLLEQVLLFPFVFKYVNLVKVSWKEVTKHIKPNLQLFIPLLAVSIYNWMDKLMLGVIIGVAPVAFYNYAESIINLPNGIITALGTVMLPALSFVASDGITASYKRTLERSMGFIIFITCALCFGIAGVATVFVPWFLGVDFYATAFLTIQLAIVMLPMSIVDVIQTQHLIPFRREAVYIRSVGLGAAVNLCLNLLLIPPLGASGAVIGTIGAQSAVCIYQLAYIRNLLPPKNLVKMLIPFLSFGLLQFAVVFTLGSLKLPTVFLLLLQIAVGASIYLLTSFGYLMLFQPAWAGLADLRKRRADHARR